MEAELAIKTLFFVGPSSTGKSTLFHAVAKEMNLDPGQCITEVARTVMRNTGFSRNTVGDIEMQKAIMKAQLDQEQVARSVAGGSAIRLVLSDRSAIDPLAYAVLTAANEDDAHERMRILVDTPEFQTALRQYREGTFILFKPVPEWLVDDGVRSIDNQDSSLEVFCNVLKELEIRYVELGEEIKDLQARVTFVMKLMNQNGVKL